jgi:hypothetical protein
VGEAPHRVTLFPDNSRRYIDPSLQCSIIGSGSGMLRRHRMETGTTAQDRSLPARTPNLLHQILPPAGLVVGLVLTTAWISFLGYQVVRLVQAVL